jgi:ABC-type transport system involved in cytochrome bd biosynthesis fused ATPase/permease subunit
LENFSFKFEAGKFYVICGKSGSGKTSLLNILSKLVHSEKTVYINTHDLQNIASVDYWNSIAYVQQKSVMIDDTLDFNITLQRPLNAELLEKSKSLAGMPNSFSKSSGEIQKVCLARAFYTQAKVLLLDEITSSMDAKSEEYVIGSLKEYAHGNNAIVILVSHSEVIQNNADVLVTI